jgi:quercetin dioxygenase-like cupin family protein
VEDHDGARSWFFVPPGGGDEGADPLGNPVHLKLAGPEVTGATRVVEIVKQPGQTSPHHEHDYTEGFYLVDGDADFTVDDECFLAPAGSFVFVGPGVRHGFTARTALRYLVILNRPSAAREPA